MFKLRYPLIALASALFGAVAAVGAYMYYVPLPRDAMVRGEALGSVDARPWLNGAITEVFPTRTVEALPESQPLPVAPDALAGFTFTYQGETRTIADLYDSQAMLGLVVVKDGVIVHESYAPDHGPGTLFTTWSVAKSFTSTLVGLAIAEGLIDSEADPLTRYLPELRGSAYEGVTIAQALQMSSGVAFDRDGTQDTVNFLTDGPVTGERSAMEIAVSYERDAEPGTKFNYNTAETQVLLELVRRVSGQSASDFMAQRLWQPVGMRYNGAWVLDIAGEAGAEIGGALFNAALRDWARFGWFIAQDGVWQGEAILPDGWVDRATASNLSHLAHGTVHPDPELGYGYQWWTRADGTFQAAGAYGQRINIDRENGLVVAKASAWGLPRDEAHSAETHALIKALEGWDYSTGASEPSLDESGAEQDSGLDVAASRDGANEALQPVEAAAERTPASAPPQTSTPAPETASTGTLPPPSVKPPLDEVIEQAVSGSEAGPETGATTPSAADRQPERQSATDQSSEDGMGVAESRFIDPEEE